MNDSQMPADDGADEMTFSTAHLFEPGDRVAVEVTGTVKVVQKTEYGVKYIVQPDDPRAYAIHTSPQYVFPEDFEPEEGEEVSAEIIKFLNQNECQTVVAEQVVSA